MITLVSLAVALFVWALVIAIEPSAARHFAGVGENLMLKLRAHAEGRERARQAYAEGYRHIRYSR